jgi:2-polyprenyl-3-methyl-5-hydroxy-6-metoxy-1,4-benzoquinol methylase
MNEMKIMLKHKDADIEIGKANSGRNKITVKLVDKNIFMPYATWETSYPVDLIEQIVNVKGPASLCDEIMRDESSDYLQENLRYDVLSYVGEEEFINKRLLDFGCGSGASTMMLRRMLPSTDIVGVELDDTLLSIAKLRAKFYGFNNVTFFKSPKAHELPDDIAEFDYIILNAVYEHLLPLERKRLMPALWNLLKPNGILFVLETPYRYFPIEIHTTGLPLINYLPDNIAFFYARRFSARNLKKNTWEDLLRKGIRGGSIQEILGNLDNCRNRPVLLEPSRLGVKDRFDLWFIHMNSYFARYSHEHLNTCSFKCKRKVFLLLSKLLKALTGSKFLSRLSLAIKKSPY